MEFEYLACKRVYSRPAQNRNGTPVVLFTIDFDFWYAGIKIVNLFSPGPCFTFHSPKHVSKSLKAALARGGFFIFALNG